jgi:hypothetical protein
LTLTCNDRHFGCGPTGSTVSALHCPGTDDTRDGANTSFAWIDVAAYRDQKIHQLDPETGAILRTIESNRFVAGVTWVEGELWHATREGDESDLRRIHPRTGEVLERVEMPPGVNVSGLESNGRDEFFCGGGKSGKGRAVRRPPRDDARSSGTKIAVKSARKKFQFDGEVRPADPIR